MDILKFLDSLNTAYKEMFLSLLLIFPLAYIVCWKLSASFPALDFMPQVILSIGIDIIAVFIEWGILSIATEIYTPSKAYNTKYETLFKLANKPVLLTFLFILPTICVLIDVPYPFIVFLAVFFGSLINILIGALLIKILFGKKLNALIEILCQVNKRIEDIKKYNEIYKNATYYSNTYSPSDR